MKKTLLLTTIILSGFVNAGPAETFKLLHFLAGGTWQTKTAKGYTCERWKIVNKTEMQSFGFRVVGKDTIAEENVRLVQNGDSIYYIPTVNGQNYNKPVPFTLVSSDNQEYVFSNPAHDFPQRVVYKPISADSLHAWIDGQYKGKLVKRDFYYKRVK